MKITVNSEKKDVEKSISLAELIKFLKIDEIAIVAEVSGKIIAPNEYNSTILQEEENVELIRFVGGG